MKAVAALALAIASSGPAGADDAEATRAAIGDVLERMTAAAARIQDYTCTFTKQEVVGGEQKPLETLFSKQRREPRCTYMKWLAEPHKDRETLYCPARYGDKLKAHDGSGLASWVTASLDPHGAIAMRSSRHAITEAGVFHLVEEFRRRYEQGTAPGSIAEATVAGRPSDCVTTLPQDRPDDVRKIELCVDKETALPVTIRSWNAEGRLVESYGYRDWKLNVGLTDRDFDLDNPDYDF